MMDIPDYVYMDTAELSLNTESASRMLAEREADRIEQALQDAVLNDRDGIDINYPPPTQPASIAYRKPEIEAWNYPAPDGDNGMRTERYEWRWFDNERLKEAIREDRLLELFDQADPDA